MSNRNASTCSVTLAMLIASTAHADPIATHSLRLPDFRVGEAVEFSRRTTEHNATRGGPPLESGSTATFDVKVVRVSANSAQLRLTLRNENFWGSATPASVTAWYSAFRGVPIEIETDPSGIPLRVINWSAIRDRVNPALTAQEQVVGPPAQRDLIEAAAAQSFLQFGPAGDLFTLAAMQFRAPTAFGHTEIPSGHLPDVHQDRSIDVLAVDPGTCRATINRTNIQTVTLGGRAHPPDVLKTSAVVSMVDGWTIRLQDTLSGANYVRTTDILRVGPAPCP